MNAKPKIALIGCRNVAPESAYSLLNGPVGVEVILIGEYAEELLSRVKELIETQPMHTDSTVRVGEPTELKDARICVVSSGVPPTHDDTEDSFLSRNIEIICANGRALKDNQFKGVLLVTTNPAELMARTAMEASGLNSEAVIGISPNSVSSFTDEADSSLPLATWCSAAGCGTEYIDSCHPDCPYFEGMLERFHQHRQTVKQKGRANMASCVMRVCEAILRDEKTVLPVGVMLNGEHAIKGAFSNVPCVIGKSGVERVLELPLSEHEHKVLLDAARKNGRMFHRLTKRTSAATGATTA
jgi:L-lactate dehydrogenase